MEVVHASCRIEPVSALAELVAADFYLRALPVAGLSAGFVEQLLPDAVASVSGIYGKFHDFADACRVMQLFFYP